MTALLTSSDVVVRGRSSTGPPGPEVAGSDAGGPDLAHDVLTGPLGPLLAVTTSAGLVSLTLLPADPDEVIGRVLSAAAAAPPEAPTHRPGAAAAHLERVEAQLDDYFAGNLGEFDLTLDWSLVPGRFARRALEATARIPYGRVATYTEVAEQAGSPRAARATGNALAANPLMVVVPCHRVVPSAGGVGRYGAGSHLKTWLLELEGALPSATLAGS